MVDHGPYTPLPHARRAARHGYLELARIDSQTVRKNYIRCLLAAAFAADALCVVRFSKGVIRDVFCIPAPSGTGCKTHLESRVKKFTPPFFFKKCKHTALAYPP